MKIKPYVILGLGTLFALASTVTVMVVSDPYTAEPGMVVLFWIALFLGVWGLVGTVLTAMHQRLSPALSIGFAWASVVVGLLAASQLGYRGWRLSTGIIFATLVISFVIWIRSKKSNKQLSKTSESSEI